MADPILRGTTAQMLQEQTIHSDPTRGKTVGQIYEGIGEDEGINLANELDSLGIEYDFHSRYGKYTIHSNDATFNNPIDDWELVGDDERKDLFQNPAWANLVTPDQMSAIRFYLENNSNPDNAFANIPPNDNNGTQLAILSGLAGGIVQRAYARYQMGNDEFSNDAYGGGYVLRHTTNTPWRWTTNIADFNVGAIYSPAHLITEITNTSLWVLPCPTRLVYKINNIPQPPLREYFGWGWKKSRSTEHTMANHRVSIVQHYVLEQWSTDDYAFF